MVTYCDKTKLKIEEDTTGFYRSTLKELEDHEKFFKAKIHLEISPDYSFHIYVDGEFFTTATGIIFVPEMFNLARTLGFHPLALSKARQKRDKKREEANKKNFLRPRGRMERR
jgi:hypothetical protein